MVVPASVVSFSLRDGGHYVCVHARPDRFHLRPSAGRVVAWPDGAWRRLSIDIGGGPREVSEVWWLQCGRRFADVRVARSAEAARFPYSSTQAFAGRSSYDPETRTMEWVNRFDTEDRAGALDRARLCPCQGNPRVLREDGDTYTEYWGRMDVGDEPGTVAESASSLRVQIGAYAITVARIGSRTVGTFFTFDGYAWTARLSASDAQAD